MSTINPMDINPSSANPTPTPATVPDGQVKIVGQTASKVNVQAAKVIYTEGEINELAIKFARDGGNFYRAGLITPSLNIQNLLDKDLSYKNGSFIIYKKEKVAEKTIKRPHNLSISKEILTEMAKLELIGKQNLAKTKALKDEFSIFPKELSKSEILELLNIPKNKEGEYHHEFGGPGSKGKFLLMHTKYYGNTRAGPMSLAIILSYCQKKDGLFCQEYVRMKVDDQGNMHVLAMNVYPALKGWVETGCTSIKEYLEKHPDLDITKPVNPKLF